MNPPTLRALFADALYQVLDNMVFRILLIVSVVLIAATFLVGFREQEVVFLWGLRRFAYQDMADFLSGLYRVPAEDLGQVDVQAALIQSIQDLLVGGLAGTLGMMLAISATAFFVPRMLEKGAADTLFSKPVPRLMLFLSRYFAGLLFVGLAALFLVGGMHIGFLVSSGHSDPGFLWTALTITYVFALLHGVTMLVGVLTRSTVASILIALLFFVGNACVHKGWRFVEQQRFSAAHFESLSEEPTGDLDELASGEESEAPAILRWMLKALDAAHYILPKTSDAPLVSAMLRESVAGIEPLLEDPDTSLEIDEFSAGFEPVDLAGFVPPRVPGEGDLAPGILLLAGERAEDGARFALFRRERRDIPFRDRTRLEGSRDAVMALAELVGSDPGAELLIRESYRVDERSAQRVQWRNAAAEPVLVSVALFQGPPSWLYVAAIEVPEGTIGPAEVLADLDEVLARVEFAISEEASSDGWFAQRFAWDAEELRFNAWFSIGTSLAFALAMLLIGWWRLSRIDF